jgi:hypothetical protein
MLIGYMRVMSRPSGIVSAQTSNAMRCWRRALMDGRYLFEDHASGAKDNWLGLAQALEIEGKTILR